MKDNYFVTCALTGNADTTQKNPHIPITPKQIAKAAEEVAKAGATMVHIHVLPQPLNSSPRCPIQSKAFQCMST